MARKHRALRLVLAVGCGAAVGCLVYRKRELIRSFLEELTGPVGGEDYEADVIRFDPAPEADEAAAPETDIIIDRTVEDAPAAQG